MSDIYQSIIDGEYVVDIDDIARLKHLIRTTKDPVSKKELKEMIRRMLDGMREAYGPGGTFEGYY